MRRFILSVCCVLITTSGIGTALAAEVSARRSLDATLPELRFDNITLTDALEFLRDVTGANIHVNWRAIEEIGIGKDVTVNVRLRSVSLRKVLRLVLSEAGGGNNLTYYIDSNVIEITTREIADRQLFTRVYPVDDLIMEVPDFDQPPNFTIQGTQAGRGGGGGGGPLTGGGGANQERTISTRADRADALVETIQAIVQPDIWNTNGGPAAIRFWNGSIIVTAPRSVHEAIGGFYD